jgi:uncharacterized protein YciI
MIGSVLIMAFPTRDELDQWLAGDPYTTGKVWQQVEVRHFAVRSSSRAS